MYRKVKVIKRNGSEVEWDANKIRQTIRWATEGIDGVDPLKLEEQFSLLIPETIKTDAILQTLISTVDALISDEEPNWTYVKARLLNMRLNKLIRYNTAEFLGEVVNRKFGYGSLETRVKIIKQFIKNGIWNKDILSVYSDKEIKEFVAMYDDEWENSQIPIVLKTLVSQYLIKSDNKTIELPQEAYLGVAMTIASVFKDEKFRSDMVKKLFNHFVKNRTISPATPILANLRTPNKNGTSCEVLAVGDNIPSISYTISKTMEELSLGRGLGIYVGKIRATGSAIKGKWGVAGGSIPYIRILDDTVSATDQLDIRQGNANITMDIWHLDVTDFLQAKDINGDVKKKLSTVFRSLAVPDIFFERLKEKGKWSLFDPYETRKILGKDLADLWGEEFKEKYLYLENLGLQGKLKLFKQIDIVPFYLDIMERVPEIGDPFLFYRDTVNKLDPNKHMGVIYSGNLCMEFLGQHKPFKDGNPIKKEYISGEEHIVYNLDDSYSATCHLSSLNFNTICDLNDEELEEVMDTVVLQLNAVMKLTHTENFQSKRFDYYFRKIGIGYIGYAHALARHNLIYGKPEALEWTNKILERIAYFGIKASVKAVDYFGVAPAFYGSDWEKGIFFGRLAEGMAKEGELGDKWIELAKLVKEKGMANTGLFAIAPNTTTSAVIGETASIMPIKTPLSEKSGIFGSEIFVAPEFDKHRWSYNAGTLYNIDIFTQYIDTYALFQRWVDMGISMEVPYISNMHDTKYLAKFFVTAWKKGIKTTYYARPSSYVCMGCAN